MTRKEAIKKIRDFGLYHAIEDLPHSTKTVEAFEMAIQALEEPERKTGEWISGAENFNTNYSHECSQCGALIDMYHGGADDYYFCPNCGAKMEEKKNLIF